MAVGDTDATEGPGGDVVAATSTLGRGRWAVASRPRELWPTIPVVASAAVGDLMTGPSRRATQLGSSHRAAWYQVEHRVLVLGDCHAVRLPNAVVVPTVPPPGDVTVGLGVIVGAGWQAGIARWWDARPRLAAVSPATVRRSLGRLHVEDRSIPGRLLEGALASCDAGAVRSTADRLVGSGAGLTPDGDDLLAAALAAFRLIGPAVGADAAAEFVDAVAPSLIGQAWSATTALSAALLEHGCRGEVADPVAMLLRALTGDGHVEAAAASVLGVGHSSGPALLEGVMIGASAAAGGER